MPPGLARARGRRGGSALCARRGGAGLGILALPPGSPTRIGSRNRERAKARRVGPGGGRGAARAAPPATAEERREEGREERGEEGEGREKAPARLPAKRPYLSGHSLSLPGGRLGAADPLPPGSSSGVRPKWPARPGHRARGAAGPCRPGQHLRRLPASPALMPGSP